MDQKLQKLLLPAVALVSMTLSGCMDDKYDLSDVDTTIGIQVSNLTIPVNLDAITLSNILDLDEGSVIKDVDGNYAVLINGDFASSDIKVNPVVLAAPTVNPIVTQISRLPIDIPSINIPTLDFGELAFSYNVSEASTDFSFSTTTVDKSIRAIDKVDVDWTITLQLSVNDNTNFFSAFNLSGFKLRLPKGLTTPGFNNVDGVITLPEINPGRGVSTYNLKIDVTGIDFTALPASEYTFTPDPSGENGGTLSINSSIAIVEGTVTGTANLATPPQKLDFSIQPVMSDINIKTFSGQLEYSLSGFNVEDVVLNDLPELLTDPSTNISLANPQLYLSINNPMAAYKIMAYSGLSLTPYRNGEAGTPASLNAGQTIQVGFDKGVSGPYKFCLSPANPSTYFKGEVEGQQVDYTGAAHVGYSALANVLAGEGLPSSISVDFTNARIGSLNGPAQVKDFVLGEPLNDVSGNYTFYAPLQFNNGSKIGYDEVTDGWYDDTLEKITISGIRLRANVTNGLPFDVTLSGYPLTLEGRQCVDPATGKPVAFNEIIIPAGRTTAIDLYCKGTVTNLDGIRYVASAIVTDGSATLQPESPLKLTDIRVTVDGSYRDEL